MDAIEQAWIESARDEINGLIFAPPALRTRTHALLDALAADLPVSATEVYNGVELICRAAEDACQPGLSAHVRLDNPAVSDVWLSFQAVAGCSLSVALLFRLRDGRIAAAMADAVRHVTMPNVEPGVRFLWATPGLDRAALDAVSLHELTDRWAPETTHRPSQSQDNRIAHTIAKRFAVVVEQAEQGQGEQVANPVTLSTTRLCKQPFFNTGHTQPHDAYAALDGKLPALKALYTAWAQPQERRACQISRQTFDSFIATLDAKALRLVRVYGLRNDIAYNAMLGGRIAQSADARRARYVHEALVQWPILADLAHEQPGLLWSLMGGRAPADVVRDLTPRFDVLTPNNVRHAPTPLRGLDVRALLYRDESHDDETPGVMLGPRFELLAGCSWIHPSTQITTQDELDQLVMLGTLMLALEDTAFHTIRRDNLVAGLVQQGLDHHTAIGDLLLMMAISPAGSAIDYLHWFDDLMALCARTGAMTADDIDSATCRMGQAGIVRLIQCSVEWHDDYIAALAQRLANRQMAHPDTMDWSPLLCAPTADDTARAYAELDDWLQEQMGNYDHDEAIANFGGVRELASIAGLMAEGQAMHNCIASMAGRFRHDILRGLSIRDTDERRWLTLSVICRKRSGQRPVIVLGSVEGPRNQPASDNEYALAERIVAILDTAPPDTVVQSATLDSMGAITTPTGDYAVVEKRLHEEQGNAALEAVCEPFVPFRLRFAHAGRAAAG